ncbi:hypothetical protein [Pseudonocardia acaciae]|uniref:hypothetical protein n=1 Tax=Pseudonocardia acaciae TaxID=551276 RepID=UPI00048A5938|nr:hypothetical protein [Pseudonocardia acaciae]
MYDSTDPRSALSASAPAATGSDGIAAPEYYDFTELEPDEVSAAGSRTWIARGQNVALAHTSPVPDDAFEPVEQASEYVLLLVHDSSSVRIAAAGETRTVSGQALVVVPPGRSEIVPTGGGDLVRLVQVDTALAARARNAASYAAPHPRVALLEAWPAPVGGERIRVYPLADIPDQPGRFGRIFRTRAFMVNFLPDWDGPRDPRKMSPHHHDDFEQLSLAVGGEFSHHIRTPWSTDMTAWRDDEHTQVASPSVTVIPPPTVHTTRATGAGTNRLIDIFSPPRADFSAQPGWVLNADDYPAP